MADRCGECSRVTETHAEGCSHPHCPHRAPQMWGATEGAQGYPGQLAEDRIVVRRSERHMVLRIDIGDL
jgi:hypothetical protein